MCGLVWLVMYCGLLYCYWCEVEFLVCIIRKRNLLCCINCFCVVFLCIYGFICNLLFWLVCLLLLSLVWVFCLWCWFSVLFIVFCSVCVIVVNCSVVNVVLILVVIVVFEFGLRILIWKKWCIYWGCVVLVFGVDVGNGVEVEGCCEWMVFGYLFSVICFNVEVVVLMKGCIFKNWVIF